MKRLVAEQLKLECPVDIEAYMLFTQTRRIDGELALRIEETWNKWLPKLSAYRLGEKKGYIVVFFDGSVEEEVDSVWKDSPALGFEIQCVAQTMIMLTMQTVLPELTEVGCAPVPEPNKILKRSLEPLGLTFENTGHLSAKYGVLTSFPLKASCEICFLKDTCPKKLFASRTED